MRIKNLFLSLAAGIICITVSAQYDAKSKTVNFGGYVTSSTDNSMDLVRALADCKRLGAKRLVFPKSTYRFRPDSLNKFMTYISNNGDYMRCFAFDLTGMSNLEIDGQGSEFLLKGYVCAFYVNQARNITLRNFTVDYERTFHSEGHILEVTDDHMDVLFSNEYPYYVDADKHLRFMDDEGVEYPWYYMLEFDSKKRETAYMVGDQWTGGDVTTIDMGDGTVRFLRKGLRGTVGNVINFGIAYRAVPVVTVSDSEDFAISDVTIHHGGGMGIIAQRTRNLSVNNVKMIPTPGKDRVVSVAADATHFVNCSGYIKMENCVFLNQTDDATNIHGVYYRIADILSDNRIMVELANGAQHGFDYLKAGMKIEFVDQKSLVTYAHGTIKSVYTINDHKFMVTMAKPLPKDIAKNHAIAGCDEYPEVLISNCVVGNNRARGFLLGSRARTIIENNKFHTPGSAILLEGDARGWFEQSGVRNLIIRNNVFDNCNFDNWNKGAIGCGSGIDREHFKTSFYNRNILVENNVFNIHRAPILYLYSVDGVTFRNNVINVTGSSYPTKLSPDNPPSLFQLWECPNFVEQNNVVNFGDPEQDK